MMVFTIIFVLLVLVGIVAYDFYFRFGARFNTDSYLEPLKGQIFLTYDDGPASPYAAWGDSIKDAENVRESILAVDPHWDFAATTSANLARVLAEYNRRALFFIRGDTLEVDAVSHDVLRQLHRSGNVLGNHSFTHTRYWQLSTNRCLNELQRTDDLLRQITGEAPILFRPPYGQWHFGHTLRMWRRASLSQYALPLMWSHTTRDWEKSMVNLSPDQLHNAVADLLRCLHASHSGIVLLQHDVWIYSVLVTRLLLDHLSEKSALQIGEPSILVQHAKQISRDARNWLGLVYYFRQRVLLIKARLRGCEKIP